MSKTLKFISIGYSLICLTFLIGCSEFDYIKLNPDYATHEVNQKNDDKRFSQKLQNMLDYTYAESAIAVKVISNNFNVLLVGEVQNINIQNSIANLIQNQPQTKHYWDYTTINLFPKLYLDNSLNKQVEQRLTKQQNIISYKLRSITVYGVAYIMGNILPLDQSSLNHALDGINSLYGITKVVNLVQNAATQ